MKSQPIFNNPRTSGRVSENAFLDKNENPFPLPPSPLEEIRDLLPEIMLNRYPDPSYRKLRECLSSITGFATENIVVGNGGDEILWLLFASYIKPGDTVLTLDPTFSEYYHLINVYHAEQRTVPLTLQESGFSLDQESFLDSISACSPSLTLIDTPNNPTGLSISSSFMEQVVRLSRGITVIDEAYGEFASSTYLEQLDKNNIPDGTVVLKTLSKAWGLAGTRLGYAICSNDVARTINRIRCPYNVNVITQEVARIMLSYQEWMESRVSTIKYIRDKFIAAVNMIPGWKAFQSNSNFVLLQSSIDLSLVESSMLNQRIHIKYMKLPGYQGNWMRISVGREEEMSLVLEVLSELSSFVKKSSDNLDTGRGIA